MIEWVGIFKGEGQAKTILAQWAVTDGAVFLPDALKHYTPSAGLWNSTDANMLNRFSKWWNHTGRTPTLSLATGGTLDPDAAHLEALVQWQKEALQSKLVTDQPKLPEPPPPEQPGPLPPPPPPITPPEEQPAKSTPVWVWVVGTLAVVGVAVLIVSAGRVGATMPEAEAA